MERRIWSASTATYLVLVGPWTTISFLTVLAAFKNPSMWGAFGVSMAVSIFLGTWVKRFRVEVDAENLKYSSLFGGRRIVPIHQIQSAKLEVGGSKFAERFLPLVRLKIRTRPESGIRDFSINVKVLRRGAGIQIASAASSNQD